MSEDGLDPVIHAPARLRIAVTLAALPDGDNLSFTTLQDLIGLTPGNLITHLRKLEDAGYVTTAKNGSGVTARTSVALTGSGRAAWNATRRRCGSCSTPPAGPRPATPCQTPRHEPRDPGIRFQNPMASRSSRTVPRPG